MASGLTNIMQYAQKELFALSRMILLVGLIAIVGCAKTTQVHPTRAVKERPTGCQEHDPERFAPTLGVHSSAEIEQACGEHRTLEDACLRCRIYNGYAENNLPNIDITNLSLGELTSYYRYWLLRVFTMNNHAYDDTRAREVVRMGLEIMWANNASRIASWRGAIEQRLETLAIENLRQQWEATLEFLWELEHVVMHPGNDVVDDIERFEELSLAFKHSLRKSEYMQRFYDVTR